MADPQTQNGTPQEEDQTAQTLQDQVDQDEQNELDLERRKKLGGEVDGKYESWRTSRRVYEFQWFLNAAYQKGKHTSESLNSATSLTELGKVDRRRKNIANKLWAKYRARFAKFVRARPMPIVIPFTHERTARLNARATEKALAYFYERADQEQKYIDVVQWAGITGKAYWWFHWDPKKLAAVQRSEDLTGTKTITDVEEGDVVLEVGSGYEVLVPDLRISRIGDQPEIMRVRIQDTAELKDTYKEFADKIKADSHMGSPFRFERQIALLAGNEAGALASTAVANKGPQSGTLVKELYVKPNSTYPRGRQVVVMNGFAVKVQDELPHGFWDFENPYPCVEFADMPNVGQFYCTTFVEQLIPLQRGYNMLRDKLETQIRLNVHPKWMVTRQARIPKGALTNEAAEVVEWNYIPGMPEPHPVMPGSIVADAWRFAQLLKEEFDDISQIHPTNEGKAGTAKSGFQTNLLQEASDTVHAPDARGFELAIKDAAYKIRRMMKQGYDVKRLLSFSGRSAIPEVFEFNQDNIDERAIIRVQIGSGLSTFKAARVQQLLELHQKGLLGDVNDPEVKRRVLSLIDMGGVEEFQEMAGRDEDMARMENIEILEGNDIPIPQFYEDHLAHFAVHTDELKNPANRDIDPAIKARLVAHALLHLKWVNPQAAFNLANELKLTKLIGPGLIMPPAQMVPTGQAQAQAGPQPQDQGGQGQAQQPPQPQAPTQ